MKATIYISGIIGEETTLVDVIRQFKSYENPTEVLAVVDSNGGSKEEGDSIYNYLEGLKAEMPVNTYAKKAYSISAKIFTVGQEREIENIDKALMIHFAWAKAEGKAEKFEIIAEALREMEEEFAQYYSELLDIDEETVKALLDNETFVSGSEAVEMGFATKLKEPAKAVAMYNVKKSNSTIMTDKKMNLRKKLLEAMAAFISSEEVEVKAELTLQDSNGEEIVFPDLEANDTPSVGDSATMGGSAISDGSYIMPSLDEATVVFVDGKVSEIIPKEEETEEVETETIEAKAEEKTEDEKEAKTEVKAEEIREISVWSVNVTNTSFEIGEVVEYEYDGETYPVSAGEFQLNDGRRIVTNASGEIVSIEEAKEVEEPIEAQAEFKELLEGVTAKVKAEFEEVIAEKDKKIKELNTKIGSKEFKAEAKENNGNQKPVKKGAARYLAAAKEL